MLPGKAVTRLMFTYISVEVEAAGEGVGQVVKRNTGEDLLGIVSIERTGEVKA